MIFHLFYAECVGFFSGVNMAYEVTGRDGIRVTIASSPRVFLTLPPLPNQLSIALALTKSNF